MLRCSGVFWAATAVWSQSVPNAFALPPGGRSLYVSHSAERQVPAGNGSTIGHFTLDELGLPTPREVLPTCAGARATVLTPDGRFAYTGCSNEGVVRAHAVGAGGALGVIGQVASPAPIGMAIARDGRTLYVSSASDSTLAAYRIGPDGLLTALGSVPSGAPAPAKGVALTPDGRFLYVSHGRPTDVVDTTLTGFALQPDGSLGSQVAAVTNGRAAFDTVITPDGRFLYVVSAGAGRVFAYGIGPDGSLSAVPGQSFPTGDFSIGAALSPDGKRIYVAALGAVQTTPGDDPSARVTGWDIAADGALEPIENLVFGSDPLGLEFSPDGRHLYLVDITEQTLTAFTVSDDGALMVLQSIGSGGLDPTSEAIAILPNQGPVAAFSLRPGAAGEPTRFDAGKASDPDGFVARYDWDFGDGTALADGGPTPEHAYGAPGRYRARLTVIDDEGCSVDTSFTGQMVSCAGTGKATTARTVVVR